MESAESLAKIFPDLLFFMPSKTVNREIFSLDFKRFPFFSVHKSAPLRSVIFITG